VELCEARNLEEVEKNLSSARPCFSFLIFGMIEHLCNVPFSSSFFFRPNTLRILSASFPSFLPSSLAARTFVDWKRWKESLWQEFQ
jgi:hypothetical protein